MSLEERQKSWTQGCFTHKLAPFASILQISSKRGESPLINRCTGIRQGKHVSHGACEHPFHTTCPVLPSKSLPPKQISACWPVMYFDLKMFKLTFVNFQVWSRYLNSTSFFFSERRLSFYRSSVSPQCQLPLFSSAAQTQIPAELHRPWVSNRAECRLLEGRAPYRYMCQRIVVPQVLDYFSY